MDCPPAKQTSAGIRRISAHNYDVKEPFKHHPVTSRPQDSHSPSCIVPCHLNAFGIGIHPCLKKSQHRACVVLLRTHARANQRLRCEYDLSEVRTTTQNRAATTVSVCALCSRQHGRHLCRPRDRKESSQSRLALGKLRESWSVS